MNPVVASTVKAPSKDINVELHRLPQTISGTGTTEDSNDVALQIKHMATLQVGAAAVRVAWRGSKGVANTVATTDLIIPAFGQFTWTVDALTTFVYLEAADGAAAYEAWVWKSS